MPISLLDQELLHYFTRLSEPQKRSLLEMIRTFINTGDDPFNPISLEQYNLEQYDLEQYNRETDEAVARVEAGEFYTHDEVVEMSESWINKRNSIE